MNFAANVCDGLLVLSDGLLISYSSGGGLSGSFSVYIVGVISHNVPFKYSLFIFDSPSMGSIGLLLFNVSDDYYEGYPMLPLFVMGPRVSSYDFGSPGFLLWDTNDFRGASSDLVRCYLVIWMALAGSSRVH